MSNIEDLIKNNRSTFFEDEPPTGHMERFQKRLIDQKNYFWPVLKVAAGILLIFSISFAFYYQKLAKDISLSEISSEFAETEFYYKNVLNKKLDQVEKQLSPQQFLAVKQELNAMEENYHHLKQDLKLNPDDQRIIHAMIHNYQLKIELLQQVLEQVRQYNHIKNKENETEQG
jgi:hypothetical protein